MSRTALIVGAGIGGLAAGIALRMAGWQIRIFERAESPRELGFGLLVSPNAIAALRALGVAEIVLARGHAPRRGEVRRLDGTLIKHAEFPPPAAMGGPTVVALRSALHGALLDTVGIDALHLHHEAVGYASAGDRVTLRFANGAAAEGDLLVGADGIGSVVRRQLHPAEPPSRPANLIAVRGAVHGAVHHLGDRSGVFYLGPGVESFLARASDTGIYWVLSLARELVPGNTRDPAAILAHLSPRFDATFRAVTSVTTDLRCDELVDRDPLPFWGIGPVTLLGDAAHPVLPQTGQGAAQAIVDAVTLGRLLGGDAEVASALRRYEAERRPKTAILVAQGRRVARLMRSRSLTVNALRELVIRLIPVKLMVKIRSAINRRAGTDARASQSFMRS